MELTRRRLLGALAVGGVGAGAYYATRGGGDNCVSRREPSWSVRGQQWSRPVEGPHGILAGEMFGTTGSIEMSRVGSFEDGEVRWSYLVAENGVGVPYADDGLVAVGTGGDRVHAFDQPTGHHRWTYDAGGEEDYGGGSWGQPVRANGAVIAAVSHADDADVDPSNDDAFTHLLLALDDADGSVRWACPLDGVAFVGPVVDGEMVVVATEAGGIHGVALGTGDRRWRDSVPGAVWSPLCHDRSRGVVYFTSDEGALAGFDAATGERRLERTFDSAVKGVARGAEQVVVSTDDGAVVAVEQDDGSVAWRNDLGTAGGPVDSSAKAVAVLDQTGVVHVYYHSGGTVTQFRVTDDFGGQCGWTPRHENANGVLLGEYEVTVASRVWLREYDLDV